MPTFRHATGCCIGRFVAESRDEALDMVARRFGHERAPKDWLWRARYTFTTRDSRPVQANVNQLLELVMLTEEEQGTTGRLVRALVYEVLGHVTEDDVAPLRDVILRWGADARRPRRRDLARLVRRPSAGVDNGRSARTVGRRTWNRTRPTYHACDDSSVPSLVPPCPPAREAR